MKVSPYISPGLIKTLPSHYIIPGYIPDNSNSSATKVIYDNISRYFNHDTNDFQRRFRKNVSVRYWAMFIAMCKGLSSSVVGNFFNKDHSTVLYAVKRIIAEIEFYDDSRSTFQHLDSIYVIDPSKIDSKPLKRFIKSWRKQQALNKSQGIP